MFRCVEVSLLATEVAVMVPRSRNTSKKTSSRSKKPQLKSLLSSTTSWHILLTCFILPNHWSMSAIESNSSTTPKALFPSQENCKRPAEVHRNLRLHLLLHRLTNHRLGHLKSQATVDSLAPNPSLPAESVISEEESLPHLWLDESTEFFRPPSLVLHAKEKSGKQESVAKLPERLFREKHQRLDKVETNNDVPQSV